VGLIGFAFFAIVANDNFFVVYGAWLEEALYLSIVTLWGSPQRSSVWPNWLEKA
jgi:hypothetical protein